MVGYQVIMYARQGLVYGIGNPNISPIFEANNEAIEYWLKVISDHWGRVETMVDALL